MGRNAKPDMTVEDHAGNIRLNAKNGALYAILKGVELTALYRSSQGLTRQVAGMETLLADMVQMFSINGLGNAGFDPDLSKSASVITILMDDALEALTEAQPPVCEDDETPLRAGNGIKGKFLQCLACGDSQPVLTPDERRDWILALAEQNKSEPPADEPTAAPEPEKADA